MAKPVSTIRAAEDSAEATQEAQLKEVEAVLASHTGDLEEFLHLVHLLQEKGLLEIFTASLEHGSDLLEILVAQANRTGSLGGIKSLIAIVQGITKLDANLVSAVFTGLGEASQVISGGDAEEITGLWDIVKIIRDPDVTTGLTAIFAILKSLGQQLHPSSSFSEEATDQQDFSSVDAKTM